MELRVVDFGILTKNFEPYVNGYIEIENEKKKMLAEIDPIKSEMESIIRRSSSGLIVGDEMSQRRDVERFKQLQDSLMKKDHEFQKILKKMQDDLNVAVYENLSIIISEWAKKNSIDLVFGKMEVIFNTDNFEATNDIIEIIKSQGNFVE